MAGCSLVLSILAACSLSVSPGEYAQGDSDASSRVPPPSVPPGGARVLLLGGQRDPYFAEESGSYLFVRETVQGLVQADGTINGFYADRAPPLSVNRYAQLLLQDGKIMTSGNSPVEGLKVAFAPIDPSSGALTADWSVLKPDGSVPESSSNLLVRPSLLVSMGGTESVALEDGGKTPVWTGKVFTTPVDMNGRTIGRPAVRDGITLSKARGQSQLFVHKDFLLAVGGRDDTGYLGDVDVFRIGEGGTLGPSKAASALPIAPRVPEVAIGSGRIFVLGGVLDDHPTEKVHFATFGDDGTIGPWTEGPALPRKLALGAGLFYKDKIYYFGGIQETSGEGGARLQTVDTIFALDVPAGGPSGTWREVGKLPSPRGGLAAVIF
ncbi:hypothetical protein [Pendulispora albinea]|uniref:Kelch repeat-containing protein n=1 Tax=Pendulispora albinea TaxID=2741071 RepID=A0ABZ2M5J6_9BACT